MKKLILSAIACFAIVISSCNQNSPAPSPATPVSTPTPTPTTTPTASMTATEAALVGDWIWDKTEEYSSGNLGSIRTPSSIQYGNGTTTTYTLYSGAHMVLKSSFYNGAVTTNSFVPQNYDADYYGFQSSSSLWHVARPATGNQLYYPTATHPSCYPIANIITLNSTNLVVQAWLPGQIANGYKCFYHK